VVEVFANGKITARPTDALWKELSVNYTNRKWQFELAMPDGWTVRESLSAKLLPRALVMVSPLGANVVTARSAFGPALDVRVGRKLMDVVALSRMTERLNYYSKGGADIAGATAVHYVSYDAMPGLKVCKVAIQRHDIQFDVTIRGEEDPPEWFTSGWRFL
jgi:hypothetical protein